MIHPQRPHPRMVKRLRNGAEFHYTGTHGGMIAGNYRDYTGALCNGIWYGGGVMMNAGPHSEFDLDWDSA